MDFAPLLPTYWDSLYTTKSFLAAETGFVGPSFLLVKDDGDGVIGPADMKET